MQKYIIKIKGSDKYLKPSGEETVRKIEALAMSYKEAEIAINDLNRKAVLDGRDIRYEMTFAYKRSKYTYDY